MTRENVSIGSQQRLRLNRPPLVAYRRRQQLQAQEQQHLLEEQWNLLRTLLDEGM